MPRALDKRVLRRHTMGMKAAVSIPDDVFTKADKLAKRLHTSRSDLYSRALAEFIARHSPDEVTDTLNRIAERVDTSIDPAFKAASRRSLRKVEW